MCFKTPLKNNLLHVHHIIEITNFKGDFEKGNKLKNLITLCNKCHKGVHYNKLSLL